MGNLTSLKKRNGDKGGRRQKWTHISEYSHRVNVNVCLESGHSFRESESKIQKYLDFTSAKFQDEFTQQHKSLGLGESGNIKVRKFTRPVWLRPIKPPPQPIKFTEFL